MRVPGGLSLRRGVAALLLGGMFMGAPAAAQDEATLIADQIQALPNGQLIASGNVEMFHRGIRLEATRVIYDQASDEITLVGPIRLTDGPNVQLIADTASLSADLRDGILRSARLVLDQQLQIAAAEIQRVDGRYTQAYRTVASSCEVCAENPTPFWQIRAQRIVHDEDEKQIYFTNATVEIGGVPVLWTPGLRLPDPSLDRARGFLAPSLRTSDRLGTQITAPYFLPWGPHADLTLAPSIATGGNFALSGTYRQAFRSGEVQLDFGLAEDNLVANTRTYIQAQGRFDLPRDFELRFDLKDVSDGAYFRDYGLPETDRVVSRVVIDRIERDRLDEAQVTYFTSFRAGEANATLPRILTSRESIRRMTPPVLGGSLEVGLSAHGHIRPSATDIAGRDMVMLGADVDWRRTFVSSTGLLTTVMAGATADYFNTREDSTAPQNASRVVPHAAVQLSFPLMRQSGGGARSVLEPIVQVAWSGPDTAPVPDEDSLLSEFDEANLFDLNRFAGRTRTEQGGRATVGVRYNRISPDGWGVDLTHGWVVAETPNPAFTPSSGLSTRVSDWMTALQLRAPNGMSLISRAQYQDDLTINKAAARLGWTRDDLNVAGTYTWLGVDGTVGRTTETNEFALSSTYVFRHNWNASLDWQYDLSSDQTAAAGLGLTYQNECATLSLSLSRRFTTSGTLQPTTNFGLFVSLDGFGNRSAGGASDRRCGI